MSKKRRNFTAQFKLKTVAQICRERDITESLYYKWRDAFMERVLTFSLTSEGHSALIGFS